VATFRGEATAGTAAVRVGQRCHLISVHLEEATDPLRGPALYSVERTFDPITMTMDTLIVGCRFSDKTRFILPAEPSSEDRVIQSDPRSESGTIVDVSRNEERDEATVRFTAPRTTLTLRLRPYAQSLRLGDARGRPRPYGGGEHAGANARENDRELLCDPGQPRAAVPSNRTFRPDIPSVGFACRIGDRITPQVALRD
jgi:hypothetical protein